jgi:TolB-like protein
MVDQLVDFQSALGEQYVLVRELGRGGMAIVYLARDNKHDRLVALKVMHGHLAWGKGPKRFVREIGFAATLNHPHIVPVLDSGETSTGLRWFTMPYVEGETLRARLKREGSLPIEQALKIAREAADALEYAHQRGVIHRDIKPENILLAGGHALVADFGVARALCTEDGGTLTADWDVVGTPSYMSPEQANADRTIDTRTDIYALGVVLYEMLTGAPPYTGTSPQMVMAKVMTSRTPPSAQRERPSVTDALDAVVGKAMAARPADRYRSAQSFTEALEAAERGIAPVVRRRRVRYAGAMIGLVLGLGAMSYYLQRPREAPASVATPVDARSMTIAVLPFDNVGDSTVAYFADGITDEVRGKLAGLSGLKVIASGSSGQYRNTTKSPEVIARELGAQYLLVGRVLWGRAGNERRARVEPELVSIPASGTAATAWQQTFDTDLRDVFQVQADIATQVAEQLQITLGATEHRSLELRPTTNLAAYRAYRRAQEIQKAGGSALIEHQAAAAYREAVERDSTFALAWAQLSLAGAGRYQNEATPGLADSIDRESARAIALAPDLPESRLARGSYYQFVRHDLARGLTEYTAGLVRAPYSPALLRQAAESERALGQWDAAIQHMRQAHQLDPRFAPILLDLGEATLYRHDYAASRAALDSALMLAPKNLGLIQDRAMVDLAQGNLAAARATLRRLSSGLDSSLVIAFMAEYEDLGWVLDSAQDRFLLTMGPEAFDDDRGPWASALSQQYGFHGDHARSRAYADTARAAFAARAAATPDDPQLLAILGVSLAYLGRKDEAMRDGERAVALLPVTSDAELGPYIEHQLVRIYLMVGEKDKALNELQSLLSHPYYVSPGWLTIDPNFAPLRGDPRFARLVASHL